MRPEWIKALVAVELLHRGGKELVAPHEVARLIEGMGALDCARALDELVRREMVVRERYVWPLYRTTRQGREAICEHVRRAA